MREYFVSRALEIDPRESRLPAWARSKLADMRRATEDATKELDALKAGTEPSPFWVESWDDQKKFYLPRHAGRLMFKEGETVLQISEAANTGRDGWLCISGGTEGIIAAPHASNVLLIRNS